MRRSISFVFTRVLPVCLVMAGTARAGDVRPARTTTAAVASATRPEIRPEVQSRLTRSPSWRSFLARHGGWKTLWNERTGTPHRAFGPAIPIPGYAGAGDPERIRMVESFLAAESGALGIDPLHLRLRRFRKQGNVRFVSFVQTYRGFDVLFSEIELRVDDRGSVMAIGVDYYPDIDLPSGPRLTPGQALARAGEHPGAGPQVSFPGGDEKVRVLPMEEGEIPPYRLVYRLSYGTEHGEEAGEIYVDAVDGEVARVDDRVVHDNVSGSVAGTVHPVLPDDIPESRPFADLWVVAGPDTVTSDSLGWFTATGLHADSVNARLRGRWIYVSRADSASGKTTRHYAEGDTLNITWDDSISTISERNVYYHATLAHNYLKAIDSSFTGLDLPLTAGVNLRSTACNAFWNGTSINFYVEGPGCVNAALSPATIYHEYAHAVNDRLYAQAGATQMFNKTAHEATADVFACLIEDTPFFARGFWGPGTYSRSLQNSRSYPADFVGQTHRDGLILGGAFWDLRVLTDPATARRLSHMAKWGVPDDAKFGAACAEWFVETLVADDDDGDLGNGTPHFPEIEAAFNAHGIGTLLFYTLSFTHTPYPETENTTHDYVISFSMSGWGDTTGAAAVKYSTDNLRTVQGVPATEFNPGSFLALIPAQPPGTMVNYFIEALDSNGTTLVEFPAGAPDEDSYSFLVGPYTSALLDDLETPGGWTAGVPGDDATAGFWERGQPQSTFNGWRGVQPGDDHTPSGSVCYVTGAAAGTDFSDGDVDGGRTTLLSPVFDLTALENAVIRYYRWYSNNLGPEPGGDAWRVDISADGGAAWEAVENTGTSSNFWKKVDLKVENYLPGADSVVLRFTAADEGPETLVEALVDDLEILTTNGMVLPVGDPAREPAQPGRFLLGGNYPNPFNGRTIITYTLPADAEVSLTIHDLLGREAARLVGGRQRAGSHRIPWDPGGLPSGIYYYRLSAGTFHGTGKLLYLK